MLCFVIFNLLFRVLEKYYVGELIDNEMPVYAEDKYVQLNYKGTLFYTLSTLSAYHLSPTLSLSLLFALTLSPLGLSFILC